MSLSSRPGSQPAFIESLPPSTYLVSKMFRVISSLLIAIALLFSPIAMTVAMAAPQDSVTVTAMDRHCAETDTSSDQDQSDAVAHCAITCSALLSLQPMVGDNVRPAKAELVTHRHSPLIGIRLEGETPPPRITPEI